MKKIYISVLTPIIGINMLTSCATIVGGSRYYAKVQIPDYPNAKIEYNESYQGTGEASFLVKRKEANNFSITIKEDGCKTETKKFTQRTFRGWAFVGSIGTFEYGVILDFITGAL